MSRTIFLLTQTCSKFNVSRGLKYFHSPASASIIPSNSGRIPVIPELPHNSSVKCPSSDSSYDLPALDPFRRVYTFPTLNRSPIIAPTPILQMIIEKMDPIQSGVKAPIKDPLVTSVTEIYAAPRLLTIRRKKMKKHKRRRRYDRDFFKYQKYHKEKKLKAERLFNGRMKKHLAELEAFQPEAYVEETIAAAKREWSDDLAPTGRKLYPHWSRLMTLEELYGLPKSEYIDKRAGLPTEEDMEKIKQLKQEYNNRYREN